MRWQAGPRRAETGLLAAKRSGGCSAVKEKLMWIYEDNVVKSQEK